LSVTVCPFIRYIKMIKSILYCFLFTSLLLSCNIQDVELVKVNGYNVGQSSSDKIKLTLNMRIDNPNNFKIAVKKTDLNLFVSGSDAGKIILEEKIIILKKTETDYDFVLIADQKHVSRAVVQAGIGIALTGKVNINVKGWIKGKVFGIGKKIDIDEKQSLSIKDLGLGQ
jgi:LEA14-like dessication related protein